MKYVDVAMTFSEIPDEVILCINISNCPFNCEGCHSQYLKQDIGTELTIKELDRIIKENKNVSTCVCIMGGDAAPSELNILFKHIKSNYPHKTAWYSGNDILVNDVNIAYLDFIKLGHYDKIKGPLTSKDTNQRLYKVGANYKLEDITYKFWK